MEILGEPTARDCYSVITVSDVGAAGSQDLMFTATYPQVLTLDRIHVMARNKGGAVGAIAWAFVFVRAGETVQSVDPGNAGDFYVPCKDVMYEGIISFNNDIGDVTSMHYQMNRRPLIRMQVGDRVFISYDRTGTDVWLRTITAWSVLA